MTNKENHLFEICHSIVVCPCVANVFVSGTKIDAPSDGCRCALKHRNFNFCSATTCLGEEKNVYPID